MTAGQQAALVFATSFEPASDHPLSILLPTKFLREREREEEFEHRERIMRIILDEIRSARLPLPIPQPCN